MQAAAARPRAVASPTGRNSECWKRYHTLDRDTPPSSPTLQERPAWWHCGQSRNAALTTSLAMRQPILTLTTDFGLADHYVGTMKGVILNICRDAQIVDISHQVSPFEIAEGAYLIA